MKTPPDPFEIVVILALCGVVFIAIFGMAEIVLQSLGKCFR